MSKRRDVLLGSLQLDAINPRFVTEQDNQRDAIRNMADEQGQKLLNLAEDIVRFGLDPSSLAIVIPADEKNKFIVVEGNRRIAALKLLRNPKIAEDVWHSGQWRRLKQLSDRFKATAIKRIPCVVMPDRESVDHWIPLRHRGAQEGRGIVDWDGQAAARYEQRRGEGRARPALQAIDYVRQRGGLDQETLDRLGDIPITTVQRLLSDPDVRTVLGLEIENGELTTSLPDDEVIKGLRRVIRDAAHGDLPVSRIDTKKLRADYISSFSRAELPAEGAPVGDNRAVTAGSEAPTPTRPKPSVPPSRLRKALIPGTCTISILDTKPNDIYHELHRLRLEQTPYAIGVLFRVFLELSVDRYCLSQKLQSKADLDHKNLRSKLLLVADHLESSGAMTKRELTAVRRAADPNHFLASSIDTFHSYVHDANFAAAPGDLRAAWNSLEPFFKKLWE